MFSFCNSDYKGKLKVLSCPLSELRIPLLCKYVVVKFVQKATPADISIIVTFGDDKNKISVLDSTPKQVAIRILRITNLCKPNLFEYSDFTDNAHV